MAVPKHFFLKYTFLVYLLLITLQVNSQTQYWALGSKNNIKWDVNSSNKLPHSDNIEMSGLRVSGIITYTVGENKEIFVSRKIIYPQLRVKLKPEDSQWQKYRAYLIRTYSDSLSPSIKINNVVFNPLADIVEINGTLVINYKSQNGLLIKRTLFPSTNKGLFIDKYELTNTSKTNTVVEVNYPNISEVEVGEFGDYHIDIRCDAKHKSIIKPNQKIVFGVYSSASIGQALPLPNLSKEWDQRQSFLKKVQNNLVFDCPDKNLVRAFEFAKIRSSESLFDSKMGIVHSPGGGRYYAGVWANDQVEYAGPFFPFLGYDLANKASLNAYRIFAADMEPNYRPITSSFEMQGDFTCCGSDRGDAAMYAYGATRFALAMGDKVIAEELWPAIQWSLEYCKRHTTSNGVIESQSDEMEGRIGTGGANLSTSALAYGGYASAIDLAKSLGKGDSIIKEYTIAKNNLGKSIESYFGADIKGYKTYRYFEGHNTFRHWMCLPLTVGIFDRKEGVVNALIDQLWTEDGLLVETGKNIFWDRGTLYGLRGILYAGYADKGYELLSNYTKKRLLGEHVPYPVEAHPEGNQAHLSAESALYGRIIIEGLFGINPTGLKSFTFKPVMPSGWNNMSLKNIHAFGHSFDIEVRKIGFNMEVTITEKGKSIFKSQKKNGEVYDVSL